MTKTLLTILVTLVFVFGAVGVTVVAAEGSQPGEALYPVWSWSAQILHQQDKAQIQARHTERTIHVQTGMHQQETFQTVQDVPTLDPCDQSGTIAQCGFYQGSEVHHANDHHQDDGNNGTNHQIDRTHHENDGSEHGHDAH